MKRSKFILLTLLTAFLLFFTFGCDPGGGCGDQDQGQISATDAPSASSSRVCNYDLSAIPEVSSARVFYPCTFENGALYGATTLSGGFTNSKENMYWLANELARQNVIVFAISASDNFSVGGYTNAHTGAIRKIKAENNRQGSPVYNKIGHIGVAGFSMGGGATLNTAHAMAADVDAAVAMAPYGPNQDLSRIDDPMLIIVGRNDTIAPANSHAGPAYRRLPQGIAAAYATLPNYGHLNWMQGGGAYRGSTSKLITAWFRYAFYDDPAAFKIIQNPSTPISYTGKQNF